MGEKAKVIVNYSRRRDQPERIFNFGQRDILPGSLHDFRSHAWEVFSGLPLPTTAEETWRRTDIHQLPVHTFRLPEEGAHKNLAPIPKELLKPLVSNVYGGQIILQPGGSRSRLNPVLKGQGVIFVDLATAEKENFELLTLLAGKLVRAEDGKFAALASALSRTGILLYVPKGVVLEKPLHSILWGAGEQLAHTSHVFVWLDEGASATYVHEMASPDETDESMHAGNIEILVANEAKLQFVELQAWGHHVWNFTNTRVRVERNGNLDWIFGAVGSKLTKSFAKMDLNGEGASGRMSGFYFSNGSQHLDLDTQQNHLAPHTTSDLLYKGALKGSSRAVWRGMIYVAPTAQKTDGYQANRNLVLSNNARADSIPGLEILADDVRCTHGATVGKLEDEQLFYLKSRGIPQNEAERMIVEGFFEPIMQRIPFEGVRERFRSVLLTKMGMV